MTSQDGLSVFWFRRDLRLHDNAALNYALNSGHKVLPIFIFDKNILNKLENKADRRVDFIYRHLNLINEQLIKYGSSLHCFFDTPLKTYENLINQHNIKTVYANEDYEPYSQNRDEQINDFLKVSGTEFKLYKDQVIFEKNEILKSDGTPYTVFTPYSKIWKNEFHNTDIKTFDNNSLVKNYYKTKPLNIIPLDTIGFKKTDLININPEINNDLIINYHNTRNFPFIENGTSNLSVHLRFGNISIREVAKIAANINETFLNELIWREFFMSILYNFPYVVDKSFKKKYDLIEWRNNENDFEKWCKGETGYPLVDAGMRQLNESGLMHNRVRMVVASFLTKHLLIDWRWGEAYFAEKLLDYELSSNNGNWQWSAGSGCDAAPYFRIFNPSEQQKKFDPDKVYCNKWLPELKNQNYLPPIVEHSFARQRALNAYKKAFVKIMG